MNLRIITKNHGADPDIGFFTKTNSKPNGHAASVGVNGGEIPQKLIISIRKGYIILIEIKLN